jgi:hypothetical protein
MSSGGLATLDLVNQLAQGFSIIATPVRMDCLYHSEEGWNNGKPRVTSFGVRAFRQPSHRRIGNEVGRLKRRNRRAIAKSYTNNVAPDRITCLVVIEERVIPLTLRRLIVENQTYLLPFPVLARSIDDPLQQMLKAQIRRRPQTLRLKKF